MGRGAAGATGKAANIVRRQPWRLASDEPPRKTPNRKRASVDARFGWGFLQITENRRRQLAEIFVNLNFTFYILHFTFDLRRAGAGQTLRGRVAYAARSKGAARRGRVAYAARGKGSAARGAAPGDIKAGGAAALLLLQVFLAGGALFLVKIGKVRYNGRKRNFLRRKLP